MIVALSWSQVSGCLLQTAQTWANAGVEGEKGGVSRVVCLQGRGTFPCDVSVLEIQQELEWNPNVSCINSWPLSIIDDGAVLYYR